MKTIKDLYNVKDQGDREVGIEIEMEGKRLLQDSTHHWKYTVDGSLRGESAEYVLRKPVPREKVDLVLRKLKEALDTNQAVLNPSDRCGVHIHINCQHLTEVQVFNFVLLYMAFEDLLVHFCGDTREGNLFCLRTKDAGHLVTALCQAMEENTFNIVQDNFFRYASCNLVALSKYGSIEFRAMSTPKDFTIISTWVKLLLAVKDAALKFGSPTEIVESISGRGATAFMKQVFGDMSELIEMKEAEDIIMDAVRRIQDIAYMPKVAEIKKKLGLVNKSKNYIFSAPREIRTTPDANPIFLRQERVAAPFTDAMKNIIVNRFAA